VPDEEVRKGAALVTFSSITQARADLDAALSEWKEAQQSGPLIVRLKELAVEKAEADLQFAKTRLERYRTLEKAAISPSEMESREHQCAAATQAVKAARAELEQARQEMTAASARSQRAVARARRVVESSVLSAPSQGTILDVPARVGEMARDVLVEMADLSEIHVIADVFEGDLLKLKVGATGTVESPSLASPIQGKVIAVSRDIDRQTKTAPVTMRMDNADALRSLLGLEVQVTLRAGGGAH